MSSFAHEACLANKGNRNTHGCYGLFSKSSLFLVLNEKCATIHLREIQPYENSRTRESHALFTRCRTFVHSCSLSNEYFDKTAN